MNARLILWFFWIFSFATNVVAGESPTMHRFLGVEASKATRSAIHSLLYQQFYVHRINRDTGTIEAYRMEKPNEESGVLWQTFVTIREISGSSIVRVHLNVIEGPFDESAGSAEDAIKRLFENMVIDLARGAPK